MKKNLQCKINSIFKESHRIFLIVAVLLLTVSTVYGGNLQQKISIKLNNATIRELLLELNRKNNFEIVFNDNDLPKEKKLTISYENAEVDKILKESFQGTNLGYRIENGSVVVFNKPNIGTQQKKITIKGKVIGEDNKPIVGATILIQGSTVGAISDNSGGFSLSGSIGSELEITYVGYETKVVKIVSDKQNFIVTLKQSSLSVDDVVVNGYYSRSKESMTGSVLVIKSEDLKKISPNNIFRALEAFEPSFQVVENNDAGSNPNNVPNILIRGKSSFEGKSNQPLFIMDGYEVSLETVFDYDVERINTITILKDASATAVYGSRAANGVVVIETKVPAFGKLSVSYSFNGTVEAPNLTDYDLMNGREKLEFERLAGVYKATSLEKQFQNDEMYQNRYKEVLKGVDTYWLSKPLQTAFKHQHSLSLGGGNEKSRYGLNVNYGSTPGVMKESTRERLGLNFTWTYLVSNKIRIGNSLSVSQNTSKDTPYGLFSDYSSVNPYERSHDEKGNVIPKLSNGNMNPLYNSMLNNENKSISTSYTDNFDVEWTIIKGLRITGRMSYTFGNSESTDFKSPKHSDFLLKPSEEKGLYVAGNGSNHSLDGNVVLNYYTLIGDKHSISASVGGNMQSSKNSTRGFSAQGFLADNLNNIDYALQYEKEKKPNGSVNKERLVGLFGNAGYAYDNRYMLDFSYRTDGSSKFGSKDRFAPFWSMGVAWNIHNEKFFKDGGWLTTAKIRSSIGYTGNVGFEAYQAQTIYYYRTENIYMHGIGADIKALGNDNLKWQRKFSVNIGLDFDLFKGLFSLSGDIYSDKTTDLLIDMSIPPSLGFSSYKENYGEMSNRGYDVSLRSQIIRNQKRDIYWSVAFGTGATSNKIDKISNALKNMNDKNNKEETTKPTPMFEEGESLDALKAVPSLGIDPQTGREVFLKRDGSYTTVWDYQDKVIVGTTTPKFRGSLSSFFSFKGVSVNLSFNFQTGAKSYNQTLASRIEGIDPVKNGDRRALTERWKVPGDRTFFKGVSLTESTSNLTTRFVQDYNFFNIGSLSLGYSLKQDVCKKIGFNGMRFNFNMSDLARFSTVKEERGLSYPYAKQFTFTVSVQL